MDMERGKKMKRWKQHLAVLAGTLTLTVSAAAAAYGANEAGGWSQDENGEWYYRDAQGTALAWEWIYDGEENTWYYTDAKGACVTGRQTIQGDTYFFDETGRMLTGWIFCERNEAAENWEGAVSDDNTYYCQEDGRMVTGWITAYDPEELLMQDEQAFTEIHDKDYRMDRYCFRENGKIYRGCKASIDGKSYVFRDDGSCMTGWILDRGTESGDQFLHVDTDSDDSDKELCRANPENLMYGSPDDGSLAKNRWVDAIPPWDEEDDDVRSFYADSSCYMVTGQGGRGSGTSIQAKRKAAKIDTIGTYQLEDWNTDINVLKVDGKYYCVENSGTRMDGLILLTGAGDEDDYRDGVYCFKDGAALRSGKLLEENVSDDDGSDGYCYYYYFSESNAKGHCKWQGYTGVWKGRLYYQGLAVGAQWETYEVVYLPTLAERDERGEGTGFFLVDASGRVMTGSKNGSTYRSSDGNTYRVKEISDQSDEYGYAIDYFDGDRDEDDHDRKIWKPLKEDDYDYIYWDAVEE